MGSITKNFSYKEFEDSAYAYNHGIANYLFTNALRDAVKELAETVLQPLRDAWGKPLTISSGYRCPELNEAVGGSKNSAHMLGYAADIQVDDKSDQNEFNTFAVKFLLEKGIPFDQAIRERSGNTSWLHIGLYNNRHEQRRQTLAIKK